MNFTDIDHSIIRYSHVWEDQRLVRNALKITPDDRVLSIASAGCNVLDLLLAGAKEVHATDVSESQIALLSLKIATIQKLDHNDMLAFLGYRECNQRVETYEKVRFELHEHFQIYWDKRVDQIALGISRIGRFDIYLDKFREQVLEPILDQGLLSALRSANTIDDVRAVFQEIESQESFAIETKKYFSRENMVQNGRHASQFVFVPETLDVGGYMWQRFCWVCKNVPLADNPYLQLIILGHYLDSEMSLLPLLKAQHYALLRARLHRVVLHHGRVEEICADHEHGYFNKMNLSNIFEYVSQDDYERSLLLLSGRMREHARLCYWNFLVERTSESLKGRSVRRDTDLSDKLWKEDRSWLYRAFHVDVVCAPDQRGSQSILKS